MPYSPLGSFLPLLQADLQLRPHESAVSFTKDLLQYGTMHDVILGLGPGEVTSPVTMWVHALDLLMERVQISEVDTSRVVAISGAGQVCLQMIGFIQSC